MNALLTNLSPSSDAWRTLKANVFAPSGGASMESTIIRAGLVRMARHTSPTFPPPPAAEAPASLPEKLHDLRSALKVATSQVSMHLTSQWRVRLFNQLDRLLSVDSWDEADEALDRSSFSTFLRMVLYQKPARLPNLGVSQRGHLLADWTTGRDSLVVEFLPQDEVRWVVVLYSNGQKESGAGRTSLHRLPIVLEPYDPAHWFADGVEKSAA